MVTGIYLDVNAAEFFDAVSIKGTRVTLSFKNKSIFVYFEDVPEPKLKAFDKMLWLSGDPDLTSSPKSYEEVGDGRVMILAECDGSLLQSAWADEVRKEVYIYFGEKRSIRINYSSISHNRELVSALLQLANNK